MPEACNKSRRGYYIFLIVIVVFFTRGEFYGAAFRAFVDMDVFMFIHSFGNLAGGAFAAYRTKKKKAATAF